MRIEGIAVYGGGRLAVRGSGGLTGRGEGRVPRERLARALGRSPFEMEAIFDETGSGGLDLALWDLAAQSLAKPVREIFGKPYRREVARLEIVTDRALVRRRCGLRLRARDVEEALAMARCLQPLPLEFWESPLDPADLDGYRALREQAAVPIAVGPGLSSSALLRDFVQTRLVDIVLPDLAVCGLTGLRRLAYPGWVFGVRVAPLCTAGSEVLAREAAACFPPVTNAIAAPPAFIVVEPGPEPTSAPEFTVGDWPCK